MLLAKQIERKTGFCVGNVTLDEIIHVCYLNGCGFFVNKKPAIWRVNFF
jgi:hypothetical protein